jgi:hypothetical protein
VFRTRGSRGAVAVSVDPQEVAIDPRSASPRIVGTRETHDEASAVVVDGLETRPAHLGFGTSIECSVRIRAEKANGDAELARFPEAV